jgi:hypothetical protein
MRKLIKIIESVQRPQITSDHGANSNKIQFQQYDVNVELLSRLEFRAVWHHQLTQKLFRNVELTCGRDVQRATISRAQHIEALNVR